MNVLFIGKWDIAGAYIADKLIREGNTACWMTSEKERVLWNKKFKGNIYRGTWRREDYMKILRANSIDTVVFMTGGLRECYEETSEYESQMLELTNVLNVLRNYPLRCLLYLSSVELDYNEIHTPVLTDLAAGEMLCEAYHNAYGLPVLILRLSCVYGSFGLDHMGYTGRVLENMKKGKEIISQYSPEDYVDAVFGEDVAVAAESLLKLGKQGTYRIMTGHPLTMKEYLECLAKAAGCNLQVKWLRCKNTAPLEFFTEESQLKLDTGWIPYYLLTEKGMAKLKKAASKQEPDLRDEDKKEWLHHLKRLWQKPYVRPCVETVLLFLLVTFFLQFTGDAFGLKYVDLRLMFVALVSCMHGITVGTLAIVLACISYAGSLIASQVDIGYLLYSVDTWIPFAVYAVTGASIGYIVDKKKDEKEALEDKYSLLVDKYDFLKLVHGETLEIKGDLQRQIITSKHSFGHAYEVAVELDSLKPELILLKVIGILENIMECDKAAVFLINSSNQHFARMKACSRSLKSTLPNSLNMDELEKIRESFRSSNIFVNTELLSGYPDYAAPIYYQEHIYGFIALYDVGTEKFTVYYQNLFRILTSLIEKNLAKALEYETAQHDNLCYPGTELLYPAVFEDRLRVMDEAGEDASHTYVLGKVYPETGIDRDEVASRIASVIRGSDCMGIDKDGDYAVILVNMTMEYLDRVKERFQRNGLVLEVGQ